MRSKIATGIMLILVTLGAQACFQNVPLVEYEPRDRSEQQIKTVLLEYLAAKQKFDVERYLACLHGGGLFHFECGRMLSKSELEQLLPHFWADLQSGNPAFYPINRECITGDYFDTGRYVNPLMTVDGDSARVVMKFTVGWWGLNHTVSLIKTDNRWLINRLDWEMN